MKTIIFVLLFIVGIQFVLKSQEVVQTVRGSVFDVDSNVPLPGATLLIEGTNPVKGAASDLSGNFRIGAVLVGRYNIRVSYVGYNPVTLREVVVGSGKEVILNIGMKESVNKVKQVTVKAISDKNQTINSMATLSSRRVNVEEANRYAGGFDDPARLVSSYAGVVSTVGNNGIVIRGNSPKGLLWRMEGVQIPNPNHFADYISLGGGAVTALSSQTMASSDFFTGAFPAGYGNAISGVFDINIRTGNTEKREHVFQAGLVGIDYSEEGPFRKNGKSSYLFNYRYSTLGLLAPILPKEMGKLTYQDLSFKLNFPIVGGTIALWGIGAYDYQAKQPDNDSTKWKSDDDPIDFKTKLTLGAIGLNIKKIIGSKTWIQVTLAATENSLDWSNKKYDETMVLQPKNRISNYKWKYTFTGLFTHKSGPTHTNKTGIIIDRMSYDINIKSADENNMGLHTDALKKGRSDLIQVYSQSQLTPTNNLTLNAGLHSQYFSLNQSLSVEPRLGIRWKFFPKQTLSIAYGLHSQLEPLELYFVQQIHSGQILQPNRKLGFNKSRQFVVGYELNFNENLTLKFEPYYQKLFNIPVVPGSFISTINLKETCDFNDLLINSGTGKNMGVDVILERFLNDGYYYLFTASVFDSKYKGGDGIERNTAYNRNYVINVLGGKEWKTGKEDRNLLSANLRFSYLGGNRVIPLNMSETMAKKEIVEDYSRAYEKKLPDAPILSLSFSYRKNKPGRSSIWSFHMINALGYKEFQEYKFDKMTNSVIIVKDLLFIPNISYKVEF